MGVWTGLTTIFVCAKLSFFLVVSSFTFVLVIVIYLLFHSAEVEF